MALVATKRTCSTLCLSNNFSYSSTALNVLSKALGKKALVLSTPSPNRTILISRTTSVAVFVEVSMSEINNRMELVPQSMAATLFIDFPSHKLLWPSYLVLLKHHRLLG